VIVKTRYRNVEAAEARKCYPGITDGDWNAKRGKDITIVTPYCQSCTEAGKAWSCGQPVYHDAEQTVGVCGHLVEIGD